MDNETRQIEEIEVLASIYGNDWCVDNADEGLYHVTLEDNRVQVKLLLEFHKNYPSSSPPEFSIVSSSLRKEEIEDISNILQNVYLDNAGETIVYQWIEKIRDWVQTKTSVSFVEDIFSEGGNQTMMYEKSIPSPTHKTISSTGTTYEKNSPSSEVFETDKELILNSAQFNKSVNICQTPMRVDKKNECETNNVSLTIIHGDPITYKKSTFQGHAAVISDPTDAKIFLRELLENKKIAHATHNIQAYRIYKEKINSFEEHFEDDGEKQAGHRLLHLMQVMNVYNVMIVVSRWFGGVHLGPDRFRLINNAARQVLEKGDLIPLPNDKKKK